MQISVSIDSDRTQKGQTPKILGAIGNTRYNEFSVLTNFVLMGFHCMYLFKLKVLAMFILTFLTSYNPNLNEIKIRETSRSCVRLVLKVSGQIANVSGTSKRFNHLYQ